MSDETVFKGRLISVRVSDGHEVVEHPGSVAVVAVDDLRRVVLTRQRRPAVGADALLEVPAGTRDQAGEAPEATAARELEEETGLRAARLEHVGTFFPSPGYTNERQELYLATGLGGEQHDAERMPLAQAVARAAAGEFADSKTALAVLLAAQRLG